ncbi:uncharacterized protein BT62DRAFT_375368 [Guyanagaster necrorhizus]|uniref:Uncharacterized protein n=1 Tax=Guyanagaster necrorhizus TaxID=856835 RepID=A0A9P8AP41_9AGAR|nr:uncharacterized protein BT62DRAFT_375368 [Guyanagaster necrorhizus MCA 3950]KAG7442564.1 hypothetical protein BT62DRAFT_375368 [Guyanagaster necrorhizus MCA 3950]
MSDTVRQDFYNTTNGAFLLLSSMEYPAPRYKDQWKGYGSQSKTIPHPPLLIIREDYQLKTQRQDYSVRENIPSGSAVILPPPSTYNGSQTTTTPSLPFSNSEPQFPPPFRLKRVVVQNQSDPIPARYFFFYGFGSPLFPFSPSLFIQSRSILTSVCPPLWLLGVLVLVHPLRYVLPFLFISDHNIETHSKEKKWGSLCLIITSILSVVGAVVCLFLVTRRDAGISGQ